eukprot:CAMPEP_0194355504 /NCGR_PEP_ID=MMETSP0174-20130528/3403_1 /TAXON_ID=216777 /ORGANISM="Proboscia alata, Strain PI-D3" /LENGTH=331 /DNA_ID=CAMNT_0039124797 /DNA_START=164 /DNA_END=1159 /DNA_ORIENTATION=+
MSKRSRWKVALALIIFFYVIGIVVYFAWTNLFVTEKFLRNDLKENNGKSKITRISLIGERHSGTNWMATHLAECFNSTELFVIDELTRYKHWFQDDKIDPNKQEKSLVVAQFRDVYQWVEAMRARPHHATGHWNGRKNQKLEWKKFLTTPWTMPRTPNDKDYLQKQFDQGKTSSAMVECQAGFSYRDLNSCLPSPFDEEANKMYRRAGAGLVFPKYEMVPDGSGRAFHSILDLRAEKIENFLSVADYNFVSKLIVVRYEDLKYGGTEMLIREIEEYTGIKAMCKPYAAQLKKPGYHLQRDQIEWLNKHVKWKTEHLIGYKQQRISILNITI